MSQYLNDRVFDNGLSVLNAETTHLYLCSQLPGTYAEATSTYAVGFYAGPTVSAPQARSPSGRKVTIAAIVDGGGAVTANGGTGAAWALVDATNSRLLAARPVASPQTVYVANGFNLAAGEIGMPLVPDPD